MRGVDRAYRAAAAAAGTPDRRRRRDNPRSSSEGELRSAVPRNQEVIRQWKVLHALESSRHGASIDALADDLDVTTRTIRRDLAALQEAGFPLYDERDEDGRVALAHRRPGAQGPRDRASRSPSCARSI